MQHIGVALVEEAQAARHFHRLLKCPRYTVVSHTKARQAAAIVMPGANSCKPTVPRPGVAAHTKTVGALLVLLWTSCMRAVRSRRLSSASRVELESVLDHCLRGLGPSTWDARAEQDGSGRCFVICTPHGPSCTSPSAPLPNRPSYRQHSTFSAESAPRRPKIPTHCSSSSSHGKSLARRQTMGLCAKCP